MSDALGGYATAHAVAASAAASAPTTTVVTTRTTTATVHAAGSTLPGWGLVFLAVLFLAVVAVALPVSLRRTRGGSAGT